MPWMTFASRAWILGLGTLTNRVICGQVQHALRGTSVRNSIMTPSSPFAATSGARPYTFVPHDTVLGWMRSVAIALVLPLFVLAAHDADATPSSDTPTDDVNRAWFLTTPQLNDPLRPL